MKITFLGTGCPEPNPRRASSGYLVETGQHRILLDCGGGVYDRLVASGRRPSDITHLFFSHLHSDHMMDYARLVHGAWDEGGAPLHVFGPAPVDAITTRLFGDDGVFAADLRARTENPGSLAVWRARGGTLPRPWPAPVVREIRPGFAFAASSSDGKSGADDGWRLESCAVTHAQPFLECMAFRLTAGGKSFVYSGDAALSPEFEKFAARADLLLHWCYRQSSDLRFSEIVKNAPGAAEIARMATRCGAVRLRVTHLRIKMDTPQGREEICRDMAAHFSGDAAIAEDLMTIQL